MYSPDQRAALAQELAGAFLEAPWRATELAESGAGCLDRWPAWMDRLAFALVSAFRSAPLDAAADLVAFIEAFLAARPASAGEAEAPAIVRLTAAPVLPSPSPAPRVFDWPVAAIDSVDALAARLELSPGQLAWLADVKGLERTVAAERLRNYRYRVLPRRSGLARVIEVPKARLKEVQRWVLREILDHIPVSDAAHGFARGRSVGSNARVHVAQPIVLRLDLRDFFASVSAGRVFGILRTAGYAPAVAHVLTGLCTSTVPAHVWTAVPRVADPRQVSARFWLGRALATPHLPQGAPTSPALANLAAFGLDRRLSGLAHSIGARYTRYADDLTFSGSHDLRRRRARIEALVAEIAADEGFALHTGKTRLHTAAARQSVCGVVVNVRPNVARGEYEQLKAILHNAALRGPGSENRAGVADFAAHLRGRIAWVAALNPERGLKLARRFDAIAWDRPADT